MLKIGTYFVRKNENALDQKSQLFPLADRFQLLQDLYDCEFQFQFVKAKLVMAYLEVFEHICDPLEQQRMMQIMTDTMARRPRIDHCHSHYFLECYRAETKCLETQLKLIREIVDYLMVSEKKENRHIKEYL
jgi:hypothetical protein